MKDFTILYDNFVATFESYAKSYADKLKTVPSVLGESMLYSLMNGGKRVRPVLALATAEIIGVSQEDILPYALALEMIHTYSLIHDDLPAMDNDDFRRGKPSSHKAFGEANAILAGDALLNEAYAICLDQSAKGLHFAIASKYLNECAGVYGMIAGQSADLYFSEKDREITEEDLQFIYEHKTGKLLLAPIVIPAILAGDRNHLPLERFGKMLGRLFQMTDDILDVTGSFDALGKSTGKDENENKLTCVRLYGLEGAKVRADLCAQTCHTLLEGVDGDTAFLNEFVDFVLRRTK